MVIRKETTKDHTEVYQLIKEAFETAEHTDGSEQDLVCLTEKRRFYRRFISCCRNKRRNRRAHSVYKSAGWQCRGCSFGPVIG